MKALITGSNGFVGSYLRTELQNYGYEVIGADLQTKNEGDLAVDILNYVQIYEVINNHKPDIIFHLAGQASVAKSWQIPQKTVELNVNGTLNVLEAVKNSKYPVRILLVGSSDQYGRIRKEQCPINEETERKPLTPYAVSKCAQEDMGRIYSDAYHLDICMTRSFNHVGVRQALGFVIPDLVCGIAQIEVGLNEVLTVGNLEAFRDFSDVRDIVRAYRLIAEKGMTGRIYNVGSGKTYQIRELLDILVKNAKKSIKVEIDPSRMRVLDTPVIECDYSLLHKDTGWQPEITIEDTLRQMLEHYRNKLMNE
jgi:GDP-4-dehydro-6-deoxy-D-mannose reductase